MVTIYFVFSQYLGLGIEICPICIKNPNNFREFRPRSNDPVNSFAGEFIDGKFV